MIKWYKSKISKRAKTPSAKLQQPESRRYSDQTCENEILDRLEAEKDRICESIPLPSCSIALKKLKRRQKLKGTRTKGINRKHISERMKRMLECLEMRQKIQDECFGGVPDEDHQRAMEELQNGLKNCKELLEFVNSLSIEEQQKLLPPDW